MTQPSTIDTQNQPQDRSAPIILFHSRQHSYDLTIRSLLKLQAPSFILKRDSTGKIACGRSDGIVTIFISNQLDNFNIQVQNNSVVTNLRWRPKKITVTSQGLINHYHGGTGKLLLSQRELDNAILALDYSPTGYQFCTAGRDFAVRIYDQTTKSLSCQYSGSKFDSKGHNNRIFSVKFIDQNLVVSGGWDSVLHLWDLRAGNSQKTIYGPNLSGDAIDYFRGKLLTGSYRDRDQIQIFDIGQGSPVKTINYSQTRSVPYVYTTIFYKGDILAGSSGHNSLSIFGKQANYQIINQIEMGGGCYSIQGWQGCLGYVNSASDFGMVNCSN